jgi:hypothetical protein
MLERATGIGPVYSAWKAGASPLGQARKIWWVARESNPVCRRRRIYSPVQSPVLLATRRKKWNRAQDLNLRPPLS